MEDSLQFVSNDPGAVKFGNFINYYDFHPPEERLKLLLDVPENIWIPIKERQFTCLDIGCNTGALTARLHEHVLKRFQSGTCTTDMSCLMIGIDIDPVLIERAKESNCHGNQILFKCVDFMSKERNQELEQFLSISEGQFDAIFCFSVTMWIHLNHGDIGLNKFLKDVSEMGRMLVIESQPWKCYKSAVKRLKRHFTTLPWYEKITIRENVEQHIEDFLTHECSMKRVHESVMTKWGRRILFFSKIV